MTNGAYVGKTHRGGEGYIPQERNNIIFLGGAPENKELIWGDTPPRGVYKKFSKPARPEKILSPKKLRAPRCWKRKIYPTTTQRGGKEESSKRGPPKKKGKKTCGAQHPR